MRLPCGLGQTCKFLNKTDGGGCSIATGQRKDGVGTVGRPGTCSMYFLESCNVAPGRGTG